MSTWDMLERAARKEHGVGDEFKMYLGECLGVKRDVYHVGLGVPVATKKGTRRWPKEPRVESWITQTMLDATCAEYERATGLCSRCMGEGRTVASISSTAPTTYRECSQCKGTGKGVS